MANRSHVKVDYKKVIHQTEKVTLLEIELSGELCALMGSGKDDGVPSICLSVLNHKSLLDIPLPEYINWDIWSYSLYQGRTLNICLVKP